MKAVFFAVALASMLLALPTGAQQGPAGVPGFPGIAASVTPDLPPAPVPPAVQAQQRKRAEAQCAGAKNFEQCLARAENRDLPATSCKRKSGGERRACLAEQARKADCSKAADTQRCAARKQAYIDCKDRTGTPLEQCVRGRISANECARSADPARCERFQKARALCTSKAGSDHQQCLRDTLVPKK